jgi:hypothetical protein
MGWIDGGNERAIVGDEEIFGCWYGKDKVVIEAISSI